MSTKIYDRKPMSQTILGRISSTYLSGGLRRPAPVLVQFEQRLDRVLLLIENSKSGATRK